MKEHEKEFDEQMDSIIPAVREFAKNYDEGVPAATGMIGYLNQFYENDSEKGMGDYLLDAGRALNQNASDSAVLADMKKVFMQGNSEIIGTIERILMQTQGSKLKKEGSWLSRMSDMGPNGLKTIYEKAYPKKTSKAIASLMKKELDDDAHMILDQMPVVRELLGGTDYNEIRKALENDDTEAFEKLVEGKIVPESGAQVDEAMSLDESMDSLTTTIESSGVAVDNAQTLIDAMVALRLMAAPYGDSTLFDFFMREDLQAEDLYPMAYLLSAGQKSLFDDVGIHSVFWSIMAGDAEEVDEENDLSQDVQVSVYDGCDRGEFEGDTAVTSEALKRTSTSGKSLFMDSTAYNVILVSSALASIGAFVYAAKAKPKLTGEALKFKVDRFVMAEHEKLNQTVGALADKYNRITEDCMNTKMKYLQEKNMVTESPLWPKDNVRAKYAHYDMQLKMRDIKAYNQLYAEDGLFAELDKKGQKVLEEYKAKKLEYKNFDEKAVRQKAYNKLSKGAKVPKGAARAFGIVCAVVAVGFAAYEIYCMTKKDHTEYTEIPGKIIDRSYPEGSEEITYINYYTVMTPEEKKADIHQKKADRWVSLYTSTDKEAGEPIFASTLTTNAASTQSNTDIIPVTAFGESASYKISDGDSAYMFFGRNENAVADATENEEEAVAAEESEETAAPADSDIDDTEASVFGGATIWIFIVLGVLVILAAGGGIYYRKRKKE